MSDITGRKSFPTIFGEARGDRNIVIAIDTSGSMYNKLDIVKTHLIEYLLDLALCKNVSFNLLEFNSEIRCWADSLVVCSHATVEVALSWIKSLAPSTGTNTLDALVTAFGNECDCVYLVTDGLPDQHSFDILDEIVYTANHRPVHCIYLTGDDADAAAVRLLENLSKETHGTFVMANIKRYGCMDKITPIYRADYYTEKMVRSVNGVSYPTTSKLCSVTTSLCGEPVFGETLHHPGLYPALAPPTFFGDANGFAYPYAYNPYWWTRYQTAKNYLKSHTRLADSLYASDMGVSPSAAIMLIGQKVLARNVSDGYYYPGTVHSQLNTDIFVVEFQATKIGDYQETKYQETSVYELISFTDALRHPVVPGHRVLAPIKDGKYAPAIVIAGMEYRSSEGTDSTLSVSFSDGQSRDLPANSAIWIPSALYDRISLELSLPVTAQKPLKNVVGYPNRSLPGYPRSGTFPIPSEYSRMYPSLVDCGDVLMDSTWFGWPRFVGMHTAMYKPRIGPPVSITAAELSQKLAEKSEKPAEKPLPIEVPKAVEKEAVCEPKEERYTAKVEEETHDKDEEERMTDDEYAMLIRDILDDEAREAAARRRLRPPRAPYEPWKNHWKTDPIPPLIEHSRPGPFRDTTLRVPMELRPLSSSGYENPSSHFATTKSAVGARRNETNIHRMQILAHPQPTIHNRPLSPQPPPRDFTKTLGENQQELERRQAMQRNYRRRRNIIREDARVNKILEAERIANLTHDQHRERVLEQIGHERIRNYKDREIELKAQEAKQQVVHEIKQLESEKARLQHEKTVQKIDARRAVQFERAEAETRRRTEDESRTQQERAAKEVRCQDRWQQRQQQLGDEEKVRLLRDQYIRGVKAGRREHFRRLEAEGQKHKELRAGVQAQNQAIHRSMITY